MANTTIANMPAAVQRSMSYKLLAVPVPRMIHKLAATPKVMPRNGGTSLTMRRWSPLDTAMAPLGIDGMAPPPQNAEVVDITATMSFYGTFVRVVEQVVLQSQDPVLNEYAARLGVSMRQTEDQLSRDCLASSASFINCVGGVNGDFPSNPERSDFNKVIRMLADNNALTLLDEIDGADKFGSAPIRESYFAMCSTNLMGNLDRVAGFVHKSQYPEMSKIPSEYGSIAELRFLMSSIGSKALERSALGNTIYNILVTGMDAYACITQDAYSASFLYRPPMVCSPLGLFCELGYKFAEVPVITNDLWVVVAKCTLLEN